MALVSADRQYTFGELDLAASRVAASVLAHCRPEDESVILLMDRCPEMFVGLLGILKTGKICVPLLARDDPSRLAAVYRAQRCPVVVTTRSSFTQSSFSGADVERVVFADEVQTLSAPLTESIHRSPDDLAFIVYTSGSTGVPKGVMHTHRNMLNNTAWYVRTYAAGASDRSILLSSCAHIAGLAGCLRPLLTGGSVDQFNVLKEGFESLAARIIERRITILSLVPTLYRQFVHSLNGTLQFPDLRLIILGGESASASDVRMYQRHFSDNCLLLNILGCTELPTIRCMEINKDTKISGTKVPVGDAIPGRDVLLIDREGRPVPDGEQGEIIVASTDMAVGYWENPEETRKHFFVSSTGIPSYRTGDLGRMLPGGLLTHEGRLDWQLNRQGIRMEPEEIERAILENEGVVAAAVRSWDVDDGEPILCAYLVRSRDDVTLQEIQTDLSSRLPSYMLPTRFQWIASLPLNRSAKIDRSALPRPEIDLVESPIADDTWQNPIEEIVLEICADTMGLPSVRRTDNLIELGMNSIAAIRITNRLIDQFDVELPMSIPLRHPILSDLSNAVFEIVTSALFPASEPA